MDNLALWTLMREAWESLVARYEPAIEPVIAESSLDPRTWSLLLAAVSFEPEPTTPAHLMIRSPYTAAEVYLNRLRIAEAKGFLIEVDPGQFRLTQAGHNVTARFIETARRAMVEADPLTPKDSKRLRFLLDQIVQNCLSSPPPPNKWCISLSFRLMPDISPPLPYIEQAFTCLSAYRDDAHLAAWEHCGLSATGTEVISLIWRKESSTVKAIFEKLQYRGHPLQVFKDAVEDLRQHGYVSGDNEHLVLTEAGQQFRDKIEEHTNRYFFKSWEAISEAERSELTTLLQQFRAGLQDGR